MASSEVEIASSPSPFGRILRDHNRSREGNGRGLNHAVFQKNFQELVREPFHNCISVPADSARNESSQQRNISVSCVASGQSNDHNHRNLATLHSVANSKGRDVSPTRNTRHSRTVDRCVARQAHENQEAASFASSNLKTQSSRASSPSPSRREASPNASVQLENSHKIQNLGASSLVQIWEARLTNQCSRTSSPENEPSTDEPPRSTEIPETVVERCDNSEEVCVDLEQQSEWIVKSEQPSLNESLDGESERVRIVDIIKKLASCSDDNDHDHSSNGSDSPTRKQCSALDHAEQKYLPQIVNFPKIRGRQAYNDLLTQMERDRHRELDSLLERHAVSRFTQRGRIQSLLRLRILQRGMTIMDQFQPQSKANGGNRSPKGSIMHIREKFSSRNEQSAINHRDTAISSTKSDTAASTMETDSSTSKVPITHCDDAATTTTKGEVVSQTSPQAQRGIVNETEHSDNLSNSIPFNEESCHQDASTCGQKSGFPMKQPGSNTSAVHEDVQEQDSLMSDVPCKEISLETTDFDSPECVKFSASPNAWNETQTAEEPVPRNSETLETAETIASMNDWEENEIAEEEDIDYQQDFGENIFDWFSDIARPRSYWEDIRQAWYQEKLNTSSDNDDIRRLIERRTVSNFLASDFRETMDRLMTCHVQIQVDRVAGQEDGNEGTRDRQMTLSHLQRHTLPAATQEEKEGKEAEEEDDEDMESSASHQFREASESTISHQLLEASDYFDHSSTLLASWSSRDHDVGDDSDQGLCTPSRQHLLSQSYHQDSQQLSSTNSPSIEMELLYDMRGHMKQLQREMSELRRAIQCCMEMQVKFQNVILQKVKSDQGEEKNSPGASTRKCVCCICNEMQVDSLLYRCGHMCTCLKCAHELQWNSGTCPICQAPILDVVRACVDS